jgi:hypothetical protein
MNAEQEAYDALVAGGGRPSHPLRLIQDVLAAPGEYRDILTFWQDRPDEWQVFTKQLRRWRRFRQFQASERRSDGSFPLYAHRVETYLAHRHDFEFPPAFRTAAGELKEDPAGQSKLATWIEYLFFEHVQSSTYKQSMAKHTRDYLEAWDALVKSGVLDPAEEAGHAALELCSTSSSQIARHMYGRRQMLNDMPRISLAGPNEARLPPKERRGRERARRKRARLEKELESRDHRAKEVSKFRQKTETYRLAKDEYDRHRVLLQWALDQVPSGVEEEGLDPDQPSILPSVEAGDEARDGADSNASCSFDRFPRLPAELRHRVWTDCLPPRPTAHFFEVLNHPRKRHMAQYWSAKEFRVAATKAHDSGYRVIYCLLAACRESRTVVAEFYRRLQHDRSSPAWQYPFPIFQTFHWIPADDLVALCFPPKQATLPAHYAITFASGPARNVAIYMPIELLMISQFGVEEEGTGRLLRDRSNSQGAVDDESQTVLIPEFLDALRSPTPNNKNNDDDDDTRPPGGLRGGIKRVYILYDGWNCSPHGSFGWPIYATSPAQERQLLARARTRGVSWHFSGARRCESAAPWYKVLSAEPDEARGLDWEWWWLGSGGNALRGRHVKDVVELSPGARVQSCVDGVQSSCLDRGWAEFKGADVLGWVLWPREARV